MRVFCHHLLLVHARCVLVVHFPLEFCICAICQHSGFFTILCGFWLIVVGVNPFFTVLLALGVLVGSSTKFWRNLCLVISVSLISLWKIQAFIAKRSQVF